jgi:hypothetical protein
MALLLLGAAPPPALHVGAIASAAQRLFRSGPEWLTGAGLAAAASASASAPPAAPSPTSSPPPPPALSSLFPKSLHRFTPPAPPAVLQAGGPTAVVATVDPYGYGGSTAHPDVPFLAPRTLAAAAFALAFAAGSSVLAEVWREARILRPPRPEPPPVVQEQEQQQQPPSSPRAAMIAQLEAARDHYAREEARLLLRQSKEDEADLKERLQEARVVRAALERQVVEQRALLRRELKAAARRRAAAA